MSTQARRKLPLVVGLSAMLLAVLYGVLGGKASEEVPPREVTAPAPATPPRPAAPVLGAAPGSPAEPLDRFLLANPDGESQGAPASDHPVKMDELRKKLPDSLYWELDAPTQDPEVLARRAEAQRKWNEVFGKIQSGDATEEEIHRYYDHRKKLSEDYISVAQLMITEYGDKLPESDKGLIDLSIRMHQDRLEEVPRQVDEALARKQLQDRRREEWIRNGKKP
jgi:hypothetical protein